MAMLPCYFVLQKKMSIFLVHYASYCLISTLNHEKKKEKKEEEIKSLPTSAQIIFLKLKIGTAQISILVCCQSFLNYRTELNV